MPSKIVSRARWNEFGADDIPNGKRLKKYAPKGVTTVDLCLCGPNNGMFQYAFCKMILVKYLAECSFWLMFQINGSGYESFVIRSFNNL